MIIGEIPPPSGAFGVDAIAMTMRFGDFLALDNVELKVRPGTFHALLGENGAGKSTLVKCIMGYYHATEGDILVGGREQAIANPKDAHALGLGMVYQHFTLVPAMTVAENLVLARDDVPAVVDWAKEKKELEAFLARMPFKVPLNARVSDISAGERQKCEILKQLYLKRRFLILDEPTSVLTPGEADEVLGMLRDMVVDGELTILMITHKFREVMAFADEVTILRRGKLAGKGLVKELTPDAMARTMIGAEELTIQPPRSGEAGGVRLELSKVRALDDAGAIAVHDVSLSVRGGEIVGIAGVSGNGQRQLVEVLAGQREAESGEIRVAGDAYHAQPRGDAPAQDVAAAGGAAEERLRRRHERRRQHRLPRIRPRALCQRRLVAQSRRLPRRCEQEDRPVQDQDPHAGYADLGAVGRQRAARGAGARTRRRRRGADRRQSLLRARFRRRGADPCRDHGRAQPRRRGAAGQRGPGRTAGIVGSSGRDVPRPVRL